MSIIDSGLSALGRLAAIGLLAGAFLLGLAGVVYMSLQGEELTVPEITGKSVADSKKELALLGLTIKERASRISAEAPGTVVEQLPKSGETVKTGQMIYVVTSKGGGEADVPESLKNTSDEEEAEKIEEMISDKPKKKTNTNTNRKKADTARDVNASTGDTNSNSNSNSNSSDSNSNKKDGATNKDSSDKNNKNAQPAKTPNPPAKPGAESRPRVSRP